MQQKNGFTLVETMIVLTIFSLFILISTPFNITRIQAYQEKLFLESFEMDILFIQQLATNSHEIIYLEFLESEYRVGTMKKTMFKRHYPKTWIINRQTLPDISFLKTGTIRKSGAMSIKTPYAKYNIIFGLGKGRCRIEKE